MMKKTFLCTINNTQCPVYCDGICRAFDEMKCEYKLSTMMTLDEVIHFQSQTRKVNKKKKENLAIILNQLDQIDKKLSRMQQKIR